MQLKILFISIVLSFALAQDFTKSYSLHWTNFLTNYVYDPLIDLTPSDLYFLETYAVNPPMTFSCSYEGPQIRGLVPVPLTYQNNMMVQSFFFYNGPMNISWVENLQSYYLGTFFTILMAISVTNTPPVYTQTSFILHWKTSYTLTIGMDPDGDLLWSRYNLAVQPTNCGIATWLNGQLIFSPNQKGSCLVYVTLTDRVDVLPSQIINITVTNSIPNTPNISLSTFWKKSFDPFDLMSLINDPDGDNVTFVGFGNMYPSNCTNIFFNQTINRVIINHQGIGICTVIYNVTDGIDYAFGFLNINFYNNPPVTQNKAMVVLWRNFQLGFNITDLLQGCYDPDNDTISLVGFGNIIPSNTATIQAVDGRNFLVNVLNSSFVNSNFSIPYIVSDGVYNTTGYVNINIYNNPPSCTQRKFIKHWTEFRDGFFINNILDGTSDIDGDTVLFDSIQPIIPIDAGQISISSLTIKNQAYPGSTFVNRDYFIPFKISDGIALTNCLINVNIYNNFPNAVSDSFNVKINQTEFDVLKNDNDPDQPKFDNILNVKSFTYTGNSKIYYNTTTRRMIFITNSNTTIREIFQYTNTDGMSESNQATVIINFEGFKNITISSSSTKILSLFFLFMIFLLF